MMVVTVVDLVYSQNTVQNVCVSLGFMDTQLMLWLEMESVITKQILRNVIMMEVIVFVLLHLLEMVFVTMNTIMKTVIMMVLIVVDQMLYHTFVQNVHVTVCINILRIKEAVHSLEPFLSGGMIDIYLNKSTY